MKVMKAMKAMKAMKVMKVMKAMKAMKVSKIAKGKRARASVWAGRKEKTATGLNKESLMKNKRGKVVSKKASVVGRRNYKHIAMWGECVAKARKELGITGFVALNGQTSIGKAFYAKAKALYEASKATTAS